MAFEDSDRRRTLLLAIVTLVAVPAIWYATQRDANDGAEASPDQVVAVDEADATSNSSNRPPLEAPDGEPIFMDGPVSDLDPGVPEIAVPRRPETPVLELTGSYRSTVAGVRSCLVRDVRSGLSVTITNLDNGRSITCVTAIGPANQVADVVMHTDTFSQLADLTDAPIPVELAQ